MTNLRDARFKKALETAPDADARPARAVAQAIRAAARRALPVPVAPAAPRRWWQRLWHSSGSPRAPWGAAFATLLLAVLVTVMWVHEPIPDARPLASSAPPAVAPAAPSTEATIATPMPPPPRLAKPAPAAPTRSANAPPAAAADKRAVEEVTAPSPPGPEQAAAPVAQSAPMPTQEQARVRSKAYSALAAEDASGVARQLNGAAAAVQTDTRLAGLEAWTVLSIQMEGRAVTLDRPLGEHLVAAMQRLASRMQQQSTPVPEVLGAEPTLRLRILSQGQTLAVMELWDESALWRRTGQADVQARIDTTEAQALLLEARLVFTSSPPH